MKLNILTSVWLVFEVVQLKFALSPITPIKIGTAGLKIKIGIIDNNSSHGEAPEIGSSRDRVEEFGSEAEGAHEDEDIRRNSTFTTNGVPVGTGMADLGLLGELDLNSPLEFLSSFCQQSCSSIVDVGDENVMEGGSANESSPTCTSPVCFPCQCEPCLEGPLALGLCCPDALPEKEVDYGRYTGCMDNMNYAVVRCPDDWPEASVRLKCENRNNPDDPVSDLLTGVSYRNEHCAICHKAQRTVPWTVEVLCQHLQFLYMALTEEELLRRAAQLPNICKIGLAPPRGVQSRSCENDMEWLGDDVVDRCNVTGLWEKYDKNIAELCEKYTALSFRVVALNSPILLFQNLFCAICNGENLRLRECLETRGTGADTDGPLGKLTNGIAPLTLLLGLSSRTSNEQTEMAPRACAPGQWLNPDGLCQNVSCAAGKLLHEHNNTCNTALPAIRGLLYQYNVTLQPDYPLHVKPLPEYLERICFGLQDVLRMKLFSHVDGFLSNITIITAQFLDDFTPYHRQVFQIELGILFLATRHVDRDDVERVIVDSLILSEWKANITLSGDRNVTLIPSGQANTRRDVARHLLLTSRSFLLLHLQAVGERGLPVRDTDVTLLTASLPSNEIIDMSTLLLCPYVEISSPRFQVLKSNASADDDGLVVKFQDAEVKIHDLRYVRFVDNKLQVCLEVLNHLPTRRGGHKGGSRKLSWQYILSMTCIPLSIFCLAVTVLVYAVLKVLRTEPGLNTLGTCCTLLLAQLSLLLASHRVLDGAWCVALGMFVHLSWLSTFLWTSVCSVHMFRVFSAKTFSGSGEASYGKLARNVAVTLLGPCVVVAVVIALSYITSGGASIGYSSSKCYLDSSLLVGVAMVLPVAFIVTLNLVLFTLTVFRIRKVTMLQVHARNDPDATLQHVDACARLSLLTGTTWVLSLLAEGLDLDWLRAVSILANGGQGVLLFMSYVTRRRVVTMLAARMGCRKDDTSLSTGATTAAKRMTSNEEDRPYVIGE